MNRHSSGSRRRAWTFYFTLVAAGVFVQRFNRKGEKVGGVIAPDTTTAGVQERPEVAMADDGRFVVVWQEDSSKILYRLYDANGNPAGATASQEVQVNVTARDFNRYPRVSMNRTTGDFVVTWAGSQDNDGSEPYFRRFSSTGLGLDGSDRQASSASANDLN